MDHFLEQEDALQGAVVSFIPEAKRYTPVKTRWEGVECFAMHPLIFAAGQSDITIKGAGVLDGFGEPWWKLRRAKQAAAQTEPVTLEDPPLHAIVCRYSGCRDVSCSILQNVL